VQPVAPRPGRRRLPGMAGPLANQRPMLLRLRSRTDFPVAGAVAAIAGPLFYPAATANRAGRRCPRLSVNVIGTRATPHTPVHPWLGSGRTEVIDLCQKTVTRSVDICSLYTRVCVCECLSQLDMRAVHCNVCTKCESVRLCRKSHGCCFCCRRLPWQRSAATTCSA
jgi:hypothetical protein